MFNRITSIKAVKEKLSLLPWLNLIEERHFQTGETNLYYDNSGDITAIYFDSHGKYIAGETLSAAAEIVPLF